MKSIGVFTSGGDAPGMNACIRAVVRTALHHEIRVFGIHHGYAGMINGEITEMNSSSVSNIIHRGGTILKTARSSEFMTPEGRAEAARHLKEFGIEALVAIGGDGTFTGGTIFFDEHGIRMVGTPGTIDNDLSGTDFTIGYDTAVNTAINAIDKIRDTADAHERLFYIEVMGRHSGFIALDVGIAGGAEIIAIPESKTDFEEIHDALMTFGRIKTSSIIVVAEGDEAGGAITIANKVKEKYGYDYRVCILGHIQRGGNPSVRDRLLASKLGAAAVDALIDGKYNVMAGEIGGKLVFTPMRETWEKKKEIDPMLLTLAKILST